MRRGLVGMALMAGLAVSPAFGHPHVFIDTGLEVFFDADGRVTAVRIEWAYDDLYSLLVIEDRGLDPDYDGVLTPEEQASLHGFDMQWEPDFPGDTYALLGAAELALGGPQDWTTRYDGGRIISTHLRHFAEPVVLAGAPLVLQVYDPGFYSAYAITGTPVLTGRQGCSAQVFEPDRDAADAILQAAIDELAGSTEIEGEFPAIGAAYSEEAQITCNAPS